MIFTKTVSTPKNTVAATPRVTPFRICYGLIYKVELYFPPGNMGNVGAAINSASRRVYPIDDLEWFIGDNLTISFDDEMLFDIATNQLEIHTYNLDELYDHIVQVRIGIASDEAIIKARLGISGVNEIAEPLSKLLSYMAKKEAEKKTYSTERLEKL